MLILHQGFFPLLCLNGFGPSVVLNPKLQQKASICKDNSLEFMYNPPKKQGKIIVKASKTVSLFNVFSLLIP